MAEIKRFDPAPTASRTLYASPDGSWVRHADHLATLAAELERWAEEFEKEWPNNRFASRLRKRAAELRGGEDG